MARIREFDPDLALQKAMNTFWSKGYRHTSLMNLVEATGVGKKGLYSVFGNKHDLYIKAMEYYKCVQAEELLFGIEKDNSSIFEVKELFSRALNFTQSDLGSRGCMVCNAMIEFGNSDSEIWISTLNHVDRFRLAIRTALLNSAENKEIDNSLDVEKHSNFLTSVLQSLMLMSRAGTDFSVMKDTVQLSLQTLE